jgi:hypothetical protein
MLLFLSRFRKNHPPQELSEAVVKDLQQALAKAEDQASESRSALQQQNCFTRWCMVCPHKFCWGKRIMDL